MKQKFKKKTTKKQQEQTTNKQANNKNKKEGPEAILKQWELNDFVVHLS